MPKIIITQEEENQRVDKVLVNHIDASRSNIQALIKEGKITLNSKQFKANYKVEIGDEIEYETLQKEVTEILPEDLNLDIVYEDDDVIIVNKPSGMVVHPGPGNWTGTMVNGLMHHTKSLSSGSEEFRPGIVHRIDKDTSGLLMVAKNDKAHASLSAQLKEKTVTRKYIALVHGNIIEDDADIDAPIGRDEKNRKKMCVTATNSKLAYTSFHVLNRYLNYTLIECQLKTGRTHQIRVHMKWIGHALVGDPVYGPKHTIDTKGQALHAKILGFIHPTTNEYMEFEADLPEEFNKTLEVVSGLNN